MEAGACKRPRLFSMKKFKVGDKVDKLVCAMFTKGWETGYTVVEPPSNRNRFAEHVYITRTNGRSIIGLPKEHLRHTPNFQIG